MAVRYCIKLVFVVLEVCLLCHCCPQSCHCSAEQKGEGSLFFSLLNRLFVLVFFVVIAVFAHVVLVVLTVLVVYVVSVVHLLHIILVVLILHIIHVVLVNNICEQVWEGSFYRGQPETQDLDLELDTTVGK